MSKLCAVEHWLSEQCMLYFHLSQLRAYAPINLKLVEGGGVGRAWGGDLTVKFSSHGQTTPVNCEKISPPGVAHCCQLFPGWMQERHKENMSK